MEHPDRFSTNLALAACRAPIIQLRSLPEIHRRLTGQGFSMLFPVLDWGLTTGQVTLSHCGSRSVGMALVGDCINLAFHLSSMANKTLPAPIVLGPKTASWVVQELPLTDLGDQEIRGRTDQGHLFGIQLT